MKTNCLCTETNLGLTHFITHCWWLVDYVQLWVAHNLRPNISTSGKISFTYLHESNRLLRAFVVTSRINERLPHGTRQIDAVSRIPGATPPKPKVQLSQLHPPRTVVFSSDNFQTERTLLSHPERVHSFSGHYNRLRWHKCPWIN